MQRYTLAVSLFILMSLLACTSEPNEQPDPSLGLTSIEITGIGSTNPTSQAHYEQLELESFVSQAFTDVNDAELALELITVETFTIGIRPTGKRLVNAIYRVTNNTEGSLTNLTFIAANRTGNTNGTAVESIKQFDGADVETVNPTIAASIIPSHGLELVALKLKVKDEIASFQGFTEAEITAFGAVAGADYLLPYGFVVRNETTNSRTLADGETGVVSFSFSIPLQSNIANDPFTMSFISKAVTDSSTRVTQGLASISIDETVESRADALGNADILHFASSKPQVDGNTTVCLNKLRIAGSEASPEAFMLNGVCPPTSFNPAANSHNASVGTSITASFAEAMADATSTTMVIQRASSGTVQAAEGSFSATSFNPNVDLLAGEVVEVSLTTGLMTTAASPGNLSRPYVYRFRSQTAGTGNGTSWTNTVMSAATNFSWAIDLGDVDANGSLDAVIANAGNSNQVCTNNGSGTFNCTNLAAATNLSTGITLADVNGDGDLDALVANYGQANQVCLNNGDASFSCTNLTADTNKSSSISTGDLDGDGDLDAIITNAGQTNRVCTNDGAANFSCAQLSNATHQSSASGLADVDGDGDLDALIANDGQANQVCKNNGSSFNCSSISNDMHKSVSLSVGDIDGDLDVDLIVANELQDSQVCINNGAGSFTCTVLAPSSAMNSVMLGDVDGDLDLDVVGTSSDSSTPNQVCKNNAASFTCSNLTANTNNSLGIELGDIDGDLDLDVLVTNIGQVNLVYKND